MQPERRHRKGDEIGGRYQVHKALAGGMGEVYLCLDLKETIPLALKTFQARFLASPKARELFEREAATWVKRFEKHPNVVRCFYMDTVDNTRFLFLEWRRPPGTGTGADPRDWLQSPRSSLEPRRPAPWSSPSTSAALLEHAQRKAPGFVHCDVKPENVLVAQGQLAKLTDFGLAKLVREGRCSPRSTGAGAPLREPWQVSSARRHAKPYMQGPGAVGGEMLVDARTDVLRRRLSALRAMMTRSVALPGVDGRRI